MLHTQLLGIAPRESSRIWSIRDQKVEVAPKIRTVC